MDISYILDPLNDAQREAVGVDAGPTLVLAGAGSGKTRVLVHRIAWYIRVLGASPYSIMAVTFTNKAAAEMRGRIEELLGMPMGGMWVGTFHGLAHRLLRQHWQEARLPQSFQILDSDDQLRLVKRTIRELELDEAQYVPRQVQWFINGRKDEGLRPQHLEDNGDFTQKTLIRIYAAYEEACQRSGQVDFAELLLRAHELWRDNPQILAHYRNRFRFVLVDEFQDTNSLQYAWLRILSNHPDHQNLFIVGDDDQSIYGWRGARIENLHSFQKDYPDARLVRLEQNYRSTGTILKAANALISHNSDRLGKELWTDSGDGEPIRLYSAFNEMDEARFVVDRIQDWVADGNTRQETAILYRSNAQSRLFEQQLISSGIPFRVYGGLRFFERAEIKTALAYLRLVANRDDDPSFERVVNTPTRGIGDRTVELIRQQARATNVSLWQAAVALVQSSGLKGRAQTAVTAFLRLIDELNTECSELELHESVERVIEGIALIDHYKRVEAAKAENRQENLEELVNAARQFAMEGTIEEGMTELDAFLAHASLESGEGQAEDWDDAVQLMTLHTAKGLEFPLVFMVGIEEELFPHSRSVEEPGRLEEERRLCYVGMTRAMQQLYMTHAESRRLHGRDSYPMPSRFLREIPNELMEEVRLRAQVSRPVTSGYVAQETSDTGFAMGQAVLHPKFGDGVIMNYEGSGPTARVQVHFSDHGPKWLMIQYANLQAI